MGPNRDLAAQATHFLHLFNSLPTNFPAIEAMLAQSVKFQHDDYPTLESGAAWMAMFKKTVETMWSDFRIEVKDVVVQGNKVWTFSKISYVENGKKVEKDSVDMMVWDDEGKLVSNKDVQRIIGS